jgi:hypothetical protein
MTSGSEPESDRASEPLSSLKRSILIGAIGFGTVSLIVFATVAFAQRWMYSKLGLSGAYVAWIAIFILLGGAALSPLMRGPRRLARFYGLFALAFLGYGVTWTTAYFILKGTAGEWAGALVASVAMALVLASWLRAFDSLVTLSAVLFVAHSIAYFAGSIFYYSMDRRIGLLLWGVFYGLVLGAGLGAALHVAQSRSSSAN